MLRRSFTAGLLAFLCFSCNKQDDDYVPADQAQGVLNLPQTPYNYSQLNLPNYFLTNDGSPLPSSVNGLDNTPANNQITDEGATLGRVLFYDKNLSANRTISCASCHKQADSFGDNAVQSPGFQGGLTRRHSMTLVNSKFYRRGRFFWDERAATLEDQVLIPMQDQTEMGLTMAQISERVSEKAYYDNLFIAAFGDKTVTTDRISKALAQFVRSIVSFHSKYDTGRAQVATMGAPFPNFTAGENQGKNLFLRPPGNGGGGGCIGCHTTEAFVSLNAGPANNGLDEVSTTDLGAFETFPTRENLRGAFKIGTLRNIALTAPYMHDGRFQTLEQVVEHYNSGIKNHPNLAQALRDQDGNPLRLNFTDAQKAALVAFLNTLTDASVATDVRWSDPFLH